ncbi:MAG: hypothetical protein OFPII_19880 [Osedax symbiont Rs1]|nr:MAG: hypothetical protein OFPII_19880 [Osedax symbiont Rs1]
MDNSASEKEGVAYTYKSLFVTKSQVKIGGRQGVIDVTANLKIRVLSMFS